MTWTKHARRRAQQRGIPQKAIEAVLEHGRRYHAGTNAYAVHLGRRDVKTARRRGLRLETYANIALVLSVDDHIITVEHMCRIPRHWQHAKCV